ncbi:MAG: hypothetical protein EOP33_01610 [Rickettsiaceae bacterium]|nr:MAG: hypothetical protein EOP33_01610 [Rickettsiaceae bacterium]
MVTNVLRGSERSVKIVKFIRSLAIILTIKIIFTISTVVAQSTEDTIIDTLSALTCETQGVGDLLRSEFSHTCIPAPFFTFLVANIIAPGTYANTVLRLKINDNNIDVLKGSCLRENRAYSLDPKTGRSIEPTISFALCNNIKLQSVRVKAAVNAAAAIGKAINTGSDPWDDIKNTWLINENDYHEVFKDKQEGDQDIMFDIGILPVVPWKVVKEDDKICVATTTLAFDWIPVGCKYIREPYPVSKYANFTDPNNSEGCYQRAYSNSRTGIVISSPLIECIKEMITNLTLGSNYVIGVGDRPTQENTTLFQFQNNMHKAVSALLAIYVIFFGFRILLSGAVPPKNELIIFVFKIIFVIYFSVGINVNSSGDTQRFDGMSSYALPFLLEGISQIAEWIVNAGVTSTLCQFSSDLYDSGFRHIALWDAIDCRLSHYVGLDIVQTMIAERASGNSKFDFFNFSIPPYFYLLIPAVISGNMMLVNLALMYPLLVISVCAYLINSTVVCLIAIAILGILSPLFVPMLLFNYTRGYFDAWVKLLISFMLQPMVVVAFIITMFSIFDNGFYGQCQYLSADVKVNSEDQSTSRTTKIFYIDNNWEHYNLDQAHSCQNSLGYILNNPVASLYNFASDTVEGIKTPTNSTKEHVSQFPFLQSLSKNPGLFFTSTKLLFDKIKDIVLALITACFTLYLMYHFSAQLSEFAADMTEGISLSGAVIKPQALFKAGMKASKAIGGAVKGLKDKGKGGGGDKDKSARGTPNTGKGDTEKGSSSGDNSADTKNRDSNDTGSSQETSSNSSSTVSIQQGDSATIISNNRSTGGSTSSSQTSVIVGDKQQVVQVTSTGPGQTTIQIGGALGINNDKRVYTTDDKATVINNNNSTGSSNNSSTQQVIRTTDNKVTTINNNNSANGSSSSSQTSVIVGDRQQAGQIQVTRTGPNSTKIEIGAKQGEDNNSTIINNDNNSTNRSSSNSQTSVIVGDRQQAGQIQVTRTGPNSTKIEIGARQGEDNNRTIINNNNNSTNRSSSNSQTSIIVGDQQQADQIQVTKTGPNSNTIQVGGLSINNNGSTQQVIRTTDNKAITINNNNSTNGSSSRSETSIIVGGRKQASQTQVTRTGPGGNTTQITNVQNKERVNNKDSKERK